MDISGFIAAALFVILCYNSSKTSRDDFDKNNKWIVLWSGITFFVRIFDTLMLFGIIKFDSVYITPTGAVLITNVISEVIFGNLYTILALIGSVMLSKWECCRKEE